MEKTFVESCGQNYRGNERCCVRGFGAITTRIASLAVAKTSGVARGVTTTLATTLAASLFAAGAREEAAAPKSTSSK